MRDLNRIDALLGAIGKVRHVGASPDVRERVRQQFVQKHPDLVRRGAGRSMRGYDPNEQTHTPSPTGINVPETLNLLKHPDAEVRRSAVVILGRMGKKEMLPHLERMLTDPDPDVRRTAKEMIDGINK